MLAHLSFRTRAQAARLSNVREIRALANKRPPLPDPLLQRRRGGTAAYILPLLLWRRGSGGGGSLLARGVPGKKASFQRPAKIETRPSNAFAAPIRGRVSAGSLAYVAMP